MTLAGAPQRVARLALHEGDRATRCDRLMGAAGHGKLMALGIDLEKSNVDQAEGVERPSLDPKFRPDSKLRLCRRGDRVAGVRRCDACQTVVIRNKQFGDAGVVRERGLMYAHVPQASASDVPRQCRLRFKRVYPDCSLCDPVSRVVRAGLAPSAGTRGYGLRCGIWIPLP